MNHLFAGLALVRPQNSRYLIHGLALCLQLTEKIVVFRDVWHDGKLSTKICHHRFCPKQAACAGLIRTA